MNFVTRLTQTNCARQPFQRCKNFINSLHSAMNPRDSRMRFMCGCGFAHLQNAPPYNDLSTILTIQDVIFVFLINLADCILLHRSDAGRDGESEYAS
jgi:hypothetical protein